MSLRSVNTNDLGAIQATKGSCHFVVVNNDNTLTVVKYLHHLSDEEVKIQTIGDIVEILPGGVKINGNSGNTTVGWINPNKLYYLEFK